MKILIIDDNTDIRMLLEMTINAMGHEFNSTPSGLEGLEMIKRERYDLVLLDLTMPNFSGLDVLNALDEEGLCTRQPIVLFTASLYLSTSDMEEKLMNKEIHSILSKPSDIDQIMQKINEIQAEYESKNK